MLTQPFKLTLPVYERVVNHFISESIRGLLTYKDKMFSQIQRSTTVHLGPIRNISGDKPLDTQLEAVSGIFEIPVESIWSGDISVLISGLNSVAAQYADKLSLNILNNIAQITEATGNIINTNGQSFSLDLFIEVMEKIPLTFDVNGQPNFPTISASPQTLNDISKVLANLTPEQAARMDELINKKRKEFYAQKRTRRLSRSS